MSGSRNGSARSLQARAQIALQIHPFRESPLADQVFKNGRKRTRRTQFLFLERFAACDPSEWLSSHEVSRTLEADAVLVQGRKQKARISARRVSLTL